MFYSQQFVVYFMLSGIVKTFCLSTLGASKSYPINIGYVIFLFVL